MAKFIFYTDEGYTTAPNDEDVKNLQVLGIEDGSTEDQATKNLFQDNDWILEMGFSKDEIKCRAIFNPSFINDLKVVLEHLWKEEEKHYEECRLNGENTDAHIFNSLRNLKAIL